MSTTHITMPEGCISCMFKATCNPPVKPSEYDFKYQSATQQAYRRGEVILKQGMKTNHLVYILSGIVKFNYEDENQKNLILAIAKAPSLLGLANILNEDINLFSIVAIDDCMGCLIDLNRLKLYALNNREFMVSILRMSTGMFRTSIFNFISLAHKQVNGRIADILIYLSKNVYQSQSFTLTLSRQELAEYAGCSKEFVIHTLRNFDADRVISINGKRIDILDLDRLKKISRNG